MTPLVLHHTEVFTICPAVFLQLRVFDTIPDIGFVSNPCVELSYPLNPQDFIYSMLVLDDLVFTGDGRGRVVCFDIRSNQKLYVLDAGHLASFLLGLHVYN